MCFSVVVHCTTWWKNIVFVFIVFDQGVDAAKRTACSEGQWIGIGENIPRQSIDTCNGGQSVTIGHCFSTQTKKLSTTHNYYQSYTHDTYNGTFVQWTIFLT